ncbi:MAG: exopolysaccharide Pel transporter PelG [Amaricoccus sp.]
MSAALALAAEPEPRTGPLAGAFRWLFAGPLLSPIATVAASAIIPVGPWLVSVMALSVISLTLTPVLGRGAIEDIRLSVVYAFATSLVATAPVATVAARLARGAAEEHGGRLVPEIYAACLIFAGLTAQIFALAVVFGFGIHDVRLAVAFVALTGSASMLWTSFAMLSALGRHWQVVGAFLLGTLLAIACALLSTLGTPSVEVLLWSFALGLSIGHHLMFTSTVGSVRVTGAGLIEAARAIWREVVRNHLLFFGVFFTMAGVWADKTVFWFSPDGMVAHSGLFHFAPYDSATFIAHLSMIPTLAAWYLFQQSELEPRVRAFWSLIGERPTYRLLSSRATELQEMIWRNVFRILFFQGACTIVLIMLAPQIVRMLSMRSDQIELLQISSVAMLLQSLFFLCTAIIMVCNRTRTFFRLALMFFVTTVALGVGFYLLVGVSAYAIFFASLISATASFVFAFRAVGDFLFTIFVRENDGLYAERPDVTPGELARNVLAAAVRRLPRDSLRAPEAAAGPTGVPA